MTNEVSKRGRTIRFGGLGVLHIPLRFEVVEEEVVEEEVEKEEDDGRERSKSRKPSKADNKTTFESNIFYAFMAKMT